MAEKSAKFPRRFVVYIIVAALGTLTFPLWYPYTPRGRQVQQSDAAHEFLQRVQPLINSDPRFANVKFGVDTSVAIIAYGQVSTAQDVEALRESIAAQKPPVPAYVHLDVGGVAKDAPVTRPQ